MTGNVQDGISRHGMRSAKFEPTLLQTHGLPPGFLHHSVASELVPTLNSSIKIKPRFQSKAGFFTNYWESHAVNCVKCTSKSENGAISGHQLLWLKHHQLVYGFQTAEQDSNCNMNYRVSTHQTGLDQSPNISIQIQV